MAKTTHFFIQTFPLREFEMAWPSESSWQPHVDIYQTDAEILIHVEAAGVPEDALKLHLENGQLIIEGERRQPPLPCPQHCVQVEISYGAFRRVLPLPADADGNAIQAHYQSGILQIVVPRKSKTQQNVKVEIR
jgi:HSP20 family protein